MKDGICYRGDEPVARSVVERFSAEMAAISHDALCEPTGQVAYFRHGRDSTESGSSHSASGSWRATETARIVRCFAIMHRAGEQVGVRLRH